MGDNAFAVSAVVVRAHLVVQSTENGGPLAELEVASFLQRHELPFDEGVVIGVCIGGDEGSPPVNGSPEPHKVLFAVRGEVLEPVVGVSEFGDFFLGDIHHLQCFILANRCFIPSGFHLLELAL